MKSEVQKVTEARAEQHPTRMFPIQRANPIPWALAEVAYATYAHHYSGQSLERLAERGGFGWYEFLHLFYGDGKFKQTDEAVAERWRQDTLRKVARAEQKEADAVECDEVARRYSSGTFNDCSREVRAAEECAMKIREGKVEP